MGTTAVISAILTLLAGIGIFLIACQMMSSNLEAASSERLKHMFAKASRSKLLGVGIGTLGTAAIQSSGATTVMTIGFVNAGIISLTQAATIIYGANSFFKFPIGFLLFLRPFILLSQNSNNVLQRNATMRYNIYK